MRKFLTILTLLFSFSFVTVPMVEAQSKKAGKTKKAKKKKKKKAKSGSSAKAGADYSPVNFLPFGVGQFVQGRPLMGAVLGGGQAAMLFLYMDRKSQITQSNKDATATIAEIEAGGEPANEEEADYLKRNADYVTKTNSEATLCLVGFMGLWGASVVEAVWDPFGSRAATSKKSADLENAEDDADRWAKQEDLDRHLNRGRFSAFAEPGKNSNGIFGLSFEKKFR